MYILDSDFLIHAYRYDFPPGPSDNGFWSWLDDLGKTYEIVIPEKVHAEIEAGTDKLIDLIGGFNHIKKEPVNSALPYLQDVLNIYGELDERQLEIIDKKADPYLVAHGLGLKAIIVTNETSQPGIINPIKKKIPDICQCAGVTCMRYPRFLWELRKK